MNYFTWIQCLSLKAKMESAMKRNEYNFKDRLVNLAKSKSNEIFYMDTLSLTQSKDGKRNEEK